MISAETGIRFPSLHFFLNSSFVGLNIAPRFLRRPARVPPRPLPARRGRRGSSNPRSRDSSGAGNKTATGSALLPAFPRLLTLLCVLVLFVMVSPRAGRGRRQRHQNTSGSCLRTIHAHFLRQNAAVCQPKHPRPGCAPAAIPPCAALLVRTAVQLHYTVPMKRAHIALATILLILWTAFLGFMFQRETALSENRLKGHRPEPGAGALQPGGRRARLERRPRGGLRPGHPGDPAEPLAGRAAPRRDHPLRTAAHPDEPRLHDASTRRTDPPASRHRHCT